MKKGLVSVTFRQHSVDEIIAMAVKAGLDCIEWGGDIHCKVGDLDEAHRICKLMEENGLETISYGSYYKIGVDNNFLSVLDTAIALNTKNIRVWAGNIASRDATKEYRLTAVLDAKCIADMARKNGITISFEYHSGTLTDTQVSTMQLLSEISRENVYTYWQPPVGSDFSQNLKDITELKVINKIMNVHVFCWYPQTERNPLENMEAEWSEYLKMANCNACLLEFVKNDSDQQFFEDAKILKRL